MNNSCFLASLSHAYTLFRSGLRYCESIRPCKDTSSTRDHQGRGRLGWKKKRSHLWHDGIWDIFSNALRFHRNFKNSRLMFSCIWRLLLSLSIWCSYCLAFAAVCYYANINAARSLRQRCSPLLSCQLVASQASEKKGKELLTREKALMRELEQQLNLVADDLRLQV